MSQQIQWFPGHMAKTRRIISENLKLCDIAVEIRDARIPQSSENPMIDDILQQKPRLILLNKSDISDKNINEEWINYYRAKGIPAMLFSAISPKGKKEVLNKISSILKEKIERQKARGIVKRSVKIMVVGVPNVGKSAFINCVSGRKAMKVENRPGVTRDKQWIKISDGFELLDTPGILWPKFEDNTVGEKLALCGSIKDEITDSVYLASKLAGFLAENYRDELTSRYNIGDALNDEMSEYDIFTLIGKKRGFLIGGGDIDEDRTAKMIIDEYRSAKIGKISLERPELLEKE